MISSKRYLLAVIFGWGLLFLSVMALAGKDYELVSPNMNLRVKVSIQDRIYYSVELRSREIILPSPVSLTVQDHGSLGIHPQIKSIKRNSVSEILHPAVPVKNRAVADRFNEISVDFKGGFGLDFRAYDDGVAYRFRTEIKDKIRVVSETVTFRFAGDHNIYFPTEESFLSHSERLYEYLPLSHIPPEKMASLPAVVDIADGPKVAITEADLEDYPGLYLKGTLSSELQGKFPAMALKENQTNDRTVEVAERADFIAETRGERSYPWRILIIAEKDAGLIESEMVYRLARPSRLEDTSWIRPGKVAWDWWNANNVYGVDFRAGINTQTYQYYIDFASEHGIEYIILDEGWYKLGDLFALNPEIDMEALLAHARKKNVGLILWVVWKTLDGQLQPALDQFEKWGIKGIKVDFMQRDDQWMVDYYRRIAEEAARRHLIVDFHGSFKPTGLRRTYPNVLTREGVRGLEHSKWSPHPTPEHNVTLPFIRMLAGPMDYTPGAMVNAQEKEFRPLFTRPMSLGTRCHQLAMYVVFESPLQMLADSPSNYLREKECLEFIARVPTVWDETRVLEAKLADYVLIARKKGDDWHVGAMTDWTPRELTVDFSFLDPGTYRIEIFQDGINADRHAQDYKRVVAQVKNTETMKIRLAPGGGWAARISKSSE